MNESREYEYCVIWEETDKVTSFDPTPTRREECFYSNNVSALRFAENLSYCKYYQNISVLRRETIITEIWSSK